MILTVNFYVREYFFFNQKPPKKGLRKELVVDDPFKALEEFIDLEMRFEGAFNSILQNYVSSDSSESEQRKRPKYESKSPSKGLIYSGNSVFIAFRGKMAYAEHHYIDKNVLSPCEIPISAFIDIVQCWQDFLKEETTTLPDHLRHEEDLEKLGYRWRSYKEEVKMYFIRKVEFDLDDYLD